MKDYVCVFSVKPAVRLDPKLAEMKLNFEGLNRKVIISKIEENVWGSTIQTGLRLKVFLKASDIEKARAEAKGFVDGILSFMTLATGVAIKIPQEEIIWEATPGVSERELTQIFYGPVEITVSRRKLDYPLFSMFIEKYLKLSPRYQECVARAIRWYRMGAGTADIFDRFNCFWIGLEALNPILKKELGVKDDLTTCPKCGYKWVPTPTVAGIREFVQRHIQGGRELYRSLRRLRVDIMHAKERLHKLGKDVQELTPRMAEILFRAICFLLKIEDWKTVNYRGILEQIPMRIELMATLVGGEPDSLGVEGKDPYFEADHSTFKVEVSEDGTITHRGESTFIPRLNPNVKCRLREMRFYGDKEVKGSITGTKITRRKHSSQV